jgi:hypothetical protein
LPCMLMSEHTKSRVAVMRSSEPWQSKYTHFTCSPRDLPTPKGTQGFFQPFFF